LAGDGTSTTVAAQVDVTGLQLLAGAPGGLGFFDGPASQARILSPIALAVDADTLFLADYTTLRRFTGGNVVTVAGQISVSPSCSGSGANSALPWLSGVALDGKGSFLMSGHDGTICRVDGLGTVSFFASVPGGIEGLAVGAGKLAAIHNGTMTELDLNSGAVIRTTDVGQLLTWRSQGIAVGDDGTVYVAARRSLPGGNQDAVVESVAGGIVTVLYSNPSTWPARRCDVASVLCVPGSLLVEPDGSLLVGDQGNATVVRVANGSASTIAGVRGAIGYLDGPALGALLGDVAGIVRDTAGNVFIGDNLNGLIRKLSVDTHVSTLAGVPPGAGQTDGPGIKARLTWPVSVAVGPSGDLLVAEFGGRILRGTAAGLFSTVAGWSPQPTHVVFGPGGQMLVSSKDSAIRSIGLDGSVTIFAGTPGGRGTRDGDALSAQFGAFAISSSQTSQGFAGGAMAFDGVDTLYVADAENSSIRAIKQGVVSTPWTYTSQIPPARPEGVAVSGGHIYVLVDGNRVEKRTPSGTLVRVYPLGYVYLGGLAVDSGGNMFIEEPMKHRVVRISAVSGDATFAFGDFNILAARPGPLPASLGSPVSVAIAPAEAPNSGAVFVADFPENAILIVRP
jgi:hypothetical protein